MNEELNLDELEAMAKNATPRPWAWRIYPDKTSEFDGEVYAPCPCCGTVAVTPMVDDACYLEALGNAGDDLFARVRAVEAEREELRLTLATMMGEAANQHVARLKAEAMVVAVRLAIPYIQDAHSLFTEIRNDWSDPRTECRAGWAATDKAKKLLADALQSDDKSGEAKCQS